MFAYFLAARNGVREGNVFSRVQGSYHAIHLFVNDKKTITLISIEPIHDSKIEFSLCRLVRTSPQFSKIKHKMI